MGACTTCGLPATSRKRGTAVSYLKILAERRAEANLVAVRCHGRLAHALSAADQRHVGLAKEDLLGARHQGLEATAAQAVNGQRGGLDRRAGLQSDVAREVGCVLALERNNQVRTCATSGWVEVGEHVQSGRRCRRCKSPPGRRQPVRAIRADVSCADTIWQDNVGAPCQQRAQPSPRGLPCPWQTCS